LQNYGGWGAVRVVPNDALAFVTRSGQALATPPACSTAMISTHEATYRIGTAIPEGTLVREKSSPAVYVVLGRTLHWIANSTELSSWGGASKIQELSDGTLNAPLWQTRNTVRGNVCGMLVRERSFAEVYYLFYGVKYWITDPSLVDVYGGWGAVKVIPNDALSFLTYWGQAPATPPDCNFGLP
jgi:hypothetical protein